MLLAFARTTWESLLPEVEQPIALAEDKKIKGREYLQSASYLDTGSTKSDSHLVPALTYKHY